MRNRTCLFCNISFISKQHSKKQILLNNFCSKRCRYAYQSIRQRTGLNKICEWCKTEFYTKKCHSDYRFCSQKCAWAYKKGKFYPKASEAMSKLVAEGKINPKRNFYKQGWYRSKITGKEEWFGSSYEEKRMIQLDELGLTWTKKHGIKIPYIDKKGNKRHYVPDFLVESNIIEEVKPSNFINSEYDNNVYKIEAAKQYCNKNNYIFRIITEKDLGCR